MPSPTTADAQQGLQLALDAPAQANADFYAWQGIPQPRAPAQANTDFYTLQGSPQPGVPVVVPPPAAAPSGSAIRMPVQTITAPPMSPYAKALAAANAALFGPPPLPSYQGQAHSPPASGGFNAALANANAIATAPQADAQATSSPDLVPNTYAAKAGAPSPAMNVPLANPADIEGIQNAQAGQAAAQQGLWADQIANNESIEKLEGGEAAEAKTRDIEAGIKAKRAETDAKEQHRRILSAYDKLSAMRVDPQRYAKSLDTGHKIMQTLANAFAGYSAGIHGGPNQAVEDYQRRVQADIDAQKDDIANGYRSIAGQEGLYEQLLKATGTPQEAEALSLTAHQEELKHAFGKIMASTQSREDYDKARAAWYAAAQQQHETMIKYHKYFPAGAMGGAAAAPGAGPKAEDVDAARATSAIAGLERDGEIPGTSWTDRLRHFIGEETGLGGSVESPEATRFYSAKDALVAAKMKLEGMSRINPENVYEYGKRWQTTEQIHQLRREVEQGIADKEAIPAKGSKGGGKRASEDEGEP
jgi:hypothetical protein